MRQGIGELWSQKPGNLGVRESWNWGVWELMSPGIRESGNGESGN